MSQKLRNACKSDILDYNMLLSNLSEYKAPHRKITGLLKSGALIRVKKGLYIFGDDYRKAPINLGLLANLIYGPSYVSLNYALSYYGMIPERVESVTSMTSKRKKVFTTQVGIFTYTYISQKRFTVGVDRLKINKEQHILFASPEKAICDFIAFEPPIPTKAEMREHLIENTRIDEEAFNNLNAERLHRISQIYRKKNVSLLYEILKEGL